MSRTKSQELFRLESKGPNLRILEAPVYLLEDLKEHALLFLGYRENYHGFCPGPDLPVVLHARTLGTPLPFFRQRVQLYLYFVESLQHFVIPVGIVDNEKNSHRIERSAFPRGVKKTQRGRPAVLVSL